MFSLRKKWLGLIKVFILSAGLSSALSSCGFHLRGAYQLPAEMSPVYLAAKNQHSELLQDLQHSLEANQLVVVSDATRAHTSIKIEKEKITSRVLSVDSKGRAREYELKLELDFSVSTEKDGVEAYDIENKRLELVRDYIQDNEAVLGTTRERATLIRDMNRDAARLIMLQIQAAYRQHTKN